MVTFSGSGRNSIVGLGVRPICAGSIGREPPVYCKYTGFPPKKAGSFKPAPSAEKPVPHSSKRIGLAPRPWERRVSTLDFSLLQTWLPHPSLDGYEAVAKRTVEAIGSMSLFGNPERKSSVQSGFPFVGFHNDPACLNECGLQLTSFL